MGKVTSNKWLPAVTNTDKKKSISTRITLGVGDASQSNGPSPAMVHGQPNLQNLRAT